MMGLRRAWLRWLSRRPSARAWSVMLPGAGWLLVFFLLPLAFMFAYSFMERGLNGKVVYDFTIEHYARFADPLYVTILVRTITYSVACTGLCLLTGYPVAYVIATAGKWKNFLIFLVILPFWTSFIVRTFAIMFLLRDSGVINQLLISTGIIKEAFMVLPIYTSLEKLDPSLLEAAEVLGAKPFARFTRVVLPLSMPGVVAGCLLVFIPSLGSFVTTDLLGGGKTVFIGNLVQNQFLKVGNWPFGSAASFVMMSMVLVAVLYYLRVRDRAQALGA
jgi:spermidine/putrescine transport system permease protein